MAQLNDLRTAVVGAMQTRASALGLAGDRVTVDYVLNWGGFVNTSFRIGDPEPRFHLKLARDPDRLASLRDWYRIHGELTARYHAPPVLDWIDLGESGAGGLLFPHLAGAVPSGWTSELRTALRAVLGRLHADRSLRELVGRDRSPPSCAEGFRDDFLDRFVADLAAISTALPPFVSPGLFAWMSDEAARLGSMVAASAAFARPADAVIHGDLWPNNLLVAPNGHWYLLDWDDCRVGDPMLDLAKLLDDGPDGSSAPSDDELTMLGTDPALAERLALYRRATLLDWIIDPLADYLEADQAEEHAGRMRERKEWEHRAALMLYRRRYGG